MRSNTSVEQVSMIYLWTALLHLKNSSQRNGGCCWLSLSPGGRLDHGRNFLWNPSTAKLWVGFFKADFLGLYHHNLVKELPKLDKTLGIWNISQHRNEQDSMRESSTNDLFTRGKRCFVSKRKWTNDFFSAKMAASSAFFICAFNAISMHVTRDSSGGQAATNRRSMEGDKVTHAVSKDFQNGHLWMITVTGLIMLENWFTVIDGGFLQLSFCFSSTSCSTWNKAMCLRQRSLKPIP